MYNNYESYSRDVLGYRQNTNENHQQTYENNTNNYNGEINREVNLENSYPEIYRVINPMIENTINMYSDRNINNDILEEMTDRIYNSLENDERYLETKNTPLKNGDVINPNAKEENRNNNFLLKDLIKILLIKQILNNASKPHVPPRPPMPPRPPRYNENYYPNYYNYENDYRYRYF